MNNLRPPFDLTTATAKVQAAENAWNSRDPQTVAQAYTLNSQWRNRDTFVTGRDAIQHFLSLKWQRELDYRLAKSLWGFRENRIAVRFQYEYHDSENHWFRAYGNELWEFDSNGLMSRREASINELPIHGSQRRFHWIAPGPRPLEHPGIPEIA